MEYAEIKQIIKDMENSKLAELSIEFPDGTKISAKNNTIIPENIQMPKVMETAAPIYNDIPKAEIKEELPNEDNLRVVMSPMVGTFYAKPSQTSDPFVTIRSNCKNR